MKSALMEIRQEPKKFALLVKSAVVEKRQEAKKSCPSGEVGLEIKIREELN